jgi:hypothetical protein
VSFLLHIPNLGVRDQIRGLSDAEFAGWNTTNRAQFFGPLTIQQLVHFHWDSKAMRIGTAGAGRCMTTFKMTWDGTRWWTPNPAADLTWPAPSTIDVAAMKTGGLVASAPETAVIRENFGCSGIKQYKMLTTTDCADNRYQWLANQVTIDFYRAIIADGLGTPVTPIYYHISTENYYIGYNFRIQIMNHPVNMPMVPFGSTTPAGPTPQAYQSPPGGGFQNPTWTFSPGNTNYTVGNRVTLTWNILGVTGTALSSATGDIPLDAGSTATLTIDDSIPALFW